MQSYEISLLPIGDDISVLDLQILSKKLAKTFSVINPKITVLNCVEIPKRSYNPHRKQFLVDHFIKIISLSPGNKALGITTVDLYTPDLNFIFGQAEINGKSCVISLNRLKQGALRNLFVSRAVKEAVHELGHTFGLKHCLDKFCVMHFSNCLADTDLKGEDFCDICKKKFILRGNS